MGWYGRRGYSFFLLIFSCFDSVLLFLQAPEGPHIYYKDGMYYLMIAEGLLSANLTLIPLQRLTKASNRWHGLEPHGNYRSLGVNRRPLFTQSIEPYSDQRQHDSIL